MIAGTQPYSSPTCASYSSRRSRGAPQDPEVDVDERFLIRRSRRGFVARRHDGVVEPERDLDIARMLGEGSRHGGSR